MKNYSRLEGFSILELLIVISMIGIITSIAIPQLGVLLPSSKDVLARDFVENLNGSLMKHNQSNYRIKYPKNDSFAGDEIQIVRTLQWRDDEDPASGSPYMRQDWHPVVSSDVSEYRIKWNGYSFELIYPSSRGIGIRLSLDGSDYGLNYQFEKGYKPIGK
jgi:prepilin-type N-terminal cleavage/methylation domain-containing protein